MQDLEDRIIEVRKSELPIPVVVYDDWGNYEIQSLEPAGRKRLGARISHAADAVKSKVRRLLRR